MIGDLILLIKRIYKQTFCVHNYKPDHIGIATGLSANRICSKCRRTEST